MTSNQIKRPLGLQLLIYGFVLLWLILAAFPFFWTMWGSFKVELDFSQRVTGNTPYQVSERRQYMEKLLQVQAIKVHGFRKSFGALLQIQQ